MRTCPGRQASGSVPSCCLEVRPAPGCAPPWYGSVCWDITVTLRRRQRPEDSGSWVYADARACLGGELGHRLSAQGRRGRNLGVLLNRDAPSWGVPQFLHLGRGQDRQPRGPLGDVGHLASAEERPRCGRRAAVDFRGCRGVRSAWRGRHDAAGLPVPSGSRGRSGLRDGRPRKVRSLLGPVEQFLPGAVEQFLPLFQGEVFEW